MPLKLVGVTVGKKWGSNTIVWERGSSVASSNESRSPKWCGSCGWKICEKDKEGK